MTNTEQQYPPVEPGQPAPHAAPPQNAETVGGAFPQDSVLPPSDKPRRNVMGVIALALSAVGFLFACIPGALIVGWVLLPIAFTLGIIAVCLRGKVKWQGLTAIIVSVVGTIVGIIVFVTVVAVSFSNAFGGTDATVTEEQPAAVAEEPAAAEVEPAAAETGTRENPAPIGSVIEGGDWTVTVNSVTLGATDQVVAANMFNEQPEAGNEYILVNYTVTYTGDDADGQMPAFVGVDFVTADGVTVDQLSSSAVAPEAMDTLSPLYEGASATGNTAIQVPSPADGVLAIRPGMVADKVFVAIR